MRGSQAVVFVYDVTNYVSSRGHVLFAYCMSSW